MSAALHLPQDLLARWISSAAHVIALQTVQASPTEWDRLFNALLHSTVAITNLSIGAPWGPDIVPNSTGDVLLQNVKKEIGQLRCSRCNTTPYSTFKFNWKNTGQCINRDVRARAIEVLRALAGVLPQLDSLQHLSLHIFTLTHQLLPVICELLLDLPSSVTALTINATNAQSMTCLHRSMVFSAIAQVTSLKELHIPDWEASVGRDLACVEPLYRLPHLDVVYVRGLKSSSAFPAGLDFKEIP